MRLSTLTKRVGLSLLLGATACSESADPVAATATPSPAQQTPAAGTPSTTQGPATTASPGTPAPAAMPPAAKPAEPAMQPAPAKPAEMTPPATAPMGMATGTAGAAAMTPAMTPDPATAGAKEYTYEEVLMLKRDDLIKAWSDAPAKEVWVGCSGKYTELRHASDGTPMSMVPMGWGGKCVPMDTKVLYNIVMDMPSAPGASNTASGPSEVKESFMDKKPAVVVIYPGGYELHFRNMGKNLWVGRQAMGGKPSGVWYPLGDIMGDGMRK